MKRSFFLLPLVLIFGALPLVGQSASLFTETDAFATKTGFRGVFVWSATQPVTGVVHYGESPTGLDRTAAAVPGAPDTAQMAVASDLERGKTYYWQVEDTLTGQRSAIEELEAKNAYTSWNGELYTINMLLQLDLESLPPEIPHDLALQEIANGMNIFAERLYDALDGYARLGKLVVTDTNLDYAANQPFGDGAGGVVCDGENTTVADVLIQSSIPFDSHTWGGWSIDNPCIGFYVGRIGQLVVPWEDELHFGYVSTHELMHYAFNAPDLYQAQNILPVETPLTLDCRNTDWDGSLMHNSGGWIGRWDLTEVDRNPALTPCLHGNAPYTWDALRTRYTNVPLNPDGPIADMFNYEAKGNPDGDGLEIWILNREPAGSTLTRYVPSDAIPACGPGLSPVVDEEGDGTTVHTVDPGLASDPNMDITEGLIRWDGAAGTLTFTIHVSDLTEAFLGSVAQTYRWYFDYEGDRYQARATRDLIGVQSFTLMNGDGTATIASGLAGEFDFANDSVSIVLEADTIPGAEPFSAGQRLDGFEIYTRRDFSTPTGAGASLITDTARGSCPYFVNQENSVGNSAPVALDDSATTVEDVPVDVAVLANDSDPDGDALFVHSASSDAGEATVNAGGTVRFVPASNQSGVQTFTYVVRDVKGASAQGTVTVTVSGIQDPPTANADVAMAPSGTPVVIDVMANDSDADGDPISVVAVSSPTFGTATTDGNTITYAPGGGFATEDAFTYTISDGIGGTGRATVTVIRTCLGAFADDLEPIPAEGWAFDHNNGGPEGTGVELTTWAHTQDPLASSPDHSFFSDASDVSANKDDRLISPAVVATSITKLSFWHRFRTEVTFDGGVLEVSTDDGATWTDVVDAGGVFEKGGYVGPANALGGRNAWHGMSSDFPLMNEVVVDLGVLAGETIRVRWRLVTDSNLGDLGWWVDDVRFRDIAITDCGPAANRAPDAVDDTATAQSGSSVAIDVLANDSDPDGDPVFVSSVTQPANGTTTSDESGVTYTPDAGFSGIDTFFYTISDGFGGSDLARVTVQVNGGPAAADDQAFVTEDRSATVDVLANDSDADGDALHLVSVGTAQHGSSAVVGEFVSYTPAPDYNGPDRFGYTVTDGNGGTASAFVNVDVAAVNDVPVAADDAATCSKNGTVDIAVLANDSDVDGDAVSIAEVGRPQHGSVSVSGGAVIFRARKGFEGTDTFSYSVTDGNGGVSRASVTVEVRK
ncbi:MAG: Ig-like domain-containing protein [Thermoanaerobaculia bacterium]